MEKLVVDFVVIGSGAAGQKAAIQAAKLGKKVLIVEKDPYPGGSCLNSGTIPSKSLREAILDLTRYNERSFIGGSCVREVHLADLNSRLQTVLEGERDILHRQFKKNRILYIHGHARFENPHEVIILGENRTLKYFVRADFFLIATGSRPRNPEHIPFDDRVILDSSRLLSIDKIPKTMLVLGGGIIGSEYASFFSILGTKVTLIDKRERMLPGLDAEIGIHLQAGLKDGGLEFIPKKVTDKIERTEKGAKVTCTDGSTFEADVLLYALGRKANVEDLHIENANLLLNDKGYLQVNDHFQTNMPHIYAAGDVIGYPSLASTSMEQGRLAALHAFGTPTHPFPQFFPLGIYTIPEISSAGMTEEEIIEKGFRYEVGRAYYYEIARSHITGSSNLGMFKILFHAETREILGVHIIGRSATEVIHIGCVAMSFGAKLDYFVDQVFNYPTFAEGYRIAALNGLNKISVAETII